VVMDNLPAHTYANTPPEPAPLAWTGS
jgi:hypothetical protein